MRLFRLLSLSWCLSAAAFAPGGAQVWAAESCTGIDRLTIGCTTTCSQAFFTAIAHAAKKHHIAVTVINLTETGQAAVADPLSTVDAVVSPGGEDIDPALYASALSEQEAHEALADDKALAKRGPETVKRTEFERDLFHSYFSDDRYRRLPVLGVCFGMQMLAVTKGVPLVVDLQKKYGFDNPRHSRGTVDVEQGTEAHEIYDRNSFVAYEDHHQGVNAEAVGRLAGNGVRITASSHKGKVPEVIEFDGRNAIGVQFHPEFSSHAVGDATFGWLIEKACEKRVADVAEAAAKVYTEAPRAMATLNGGLTHCP